ncbi:MAG TPA: hypothetical protein VJ843_03715 [Candidatus Saccharimonadales bacterium]|nr:hypothetical protein [Candidatus Saccharimonadales bacterium]
MSNNAEDLTPRWWAKTTLKILALTAGIIWKFWLHPHYTALATAMLGITMLIVVAAMLWVRRSTKLGACLLLLPLGSLVATTYLYATHL